MRSRDEKKRNLYLSFTYFYLCSYANYIPNLNIYLFEFEFKFLDLGCTCPDMAHDPTMNHARLIT